MELIDKKLLYEKKEELFEFISQVGEEYIKKIIDSLWGNILFNPSLEELNETIYNPFEYENIAKTKEEMEFYHLINMLSLMKWDGVTSFSPRLVQLFSKARFFYEKSDPYLEIFRILKINDFLNGNCLEVAAGEYPTLAELVDIELNKNNHKLTIYEPNIVVNKLQNITIIKDNFTKKTDISNIDTLYGLFTCEATIPLAEKAFEEDKNLLLAFCGCDHSTKKLINNYWCEDVCMEFKEKYGNEAEIIKWPEKYEIPYPIMIRRKKEKQKTYNR